MKIIVFIFSSFVIDDRAIILDHGSPSAKNQIKQLAAAEGKFFFLTLCLQGQHRQ